MQSHGEPKLHFSKSLLAVAVSSAVSGGAYAQQQQQQQQAGLEEIIVTARKRSENLQDIPQSIQAISEVTLQRADVDGIDDYVRMIPSMSYVTYGPGTSKLVFRGVADSATSFIADSSAGIYLDEQPLTQNAQNPEVRMIDIARIEALPGPQGSLYGASSESGTLRIITNPPDPNVFTAETTGTVNAGPKSEMSYEVSAVLNIPLKEDTVGLRLVGFNARDGGFVDNVLGTSCGWRDPRLSDPPCSGTRTNAAFVRKDVNRADYDGGRATLLWNVGDRWQINTGIVTQSLDSNGDQSYQPEAGDLAIVRFHDEPRTDDWTQYQFTLKGDVGFADLISATSYFDRKVDYMYDTTLYNAYLSSFFNPAYINSYYPQYAFAQYAWGKFVNAYDFQGDPTGFAFQTQRTKRLAQELRLSHDGGRVQWIAGLFYEKFDDHWDYNIRIEDYENTYAFENYMQNFPDIGPGTTGGVTYNSNNKTITTQYALFGEVTINFTDKWSLTTGGRWFDTKRDRTYFQEIPNNHLVALANPIATLRDFAPKLSVRYRFDDQHMMYALYSQGFRNGGANINRPGSVLPKVYGADFLDNYELGLKSRWADGKLQINATGYHMLWNDYQLEVVDPGPLYAVAVANVGNAEINGVELNIDIAPTESFTIGANIGYLKSEAKNVDPIVGTPDGARLPNTPDFKGSGYAEYRWPMAGIQGSGFVYLSYTYVGESFNDIDTTAAGGDPPLRQAPYQITDLNIGIEGKGWKASFSIDNVFDERAQLYNRFPAGRINDGGTGIPLGGRTVNRPVEYGLSFTKSWGG
jgi:iron complex outermembrane recepter protein